MSRPHPRRLAGALLLLSCLAPWAEGQTRRPKPAPKPKPEAKAKADPDAAAAADPDAPPLSMSKVIACESVAGFGDYEPRDSTRWTADEKLLIYFEPRHFATEKAGTKYQAHLVQGAHLRRRDRKAFLWGKTKLIDYVAKSDSVPPVIYLTNTIALKGYPPGEYDLDITLHDEIGEGATATQTFRFTIVEAKGPADEP